ncbi:hypothetical protein [Clostridium sp.]|uniref:hypothetical protein n=1 Tax=Clostridium sp. TaxID=1506 RepID=UPI00283BF0D1|nr:hypothetical protein [Clostridium sp.]MDR3597445.1 hypothetical protein [Clostridium sp.]
MTVENELAKGNSVKLKLNDYDFNMMTQVLYHKNKWLTPAMKELIKELKATNS